MRNAFLPRAFPPPAATSSQENRVGLLQKPQECEARASGSLLLFETRSLQTKIGCLALLPSLFSQAQLGASGEHKFC